MLGCETKEEFYAIKDFLILEINFDILEAI